MHTFASDPYDVVRSESLDLQLVSNDWEIFAQKVVRRLGQIGKGHWDRHISWSISHCFARIPNEIMLVLRDSEQKKSNFGGACVSLMSASARFSGLAREQQFPIAIGRLVSDSARAQLFSPSACTYTH